MAGLCAVLALALSGCASMALTGCAGEPRCGRAMPTSPPATAAGAQTKDRHQAAEIPVAGLAVPSHIQQGNFVSQEMLTQLKVGQTRDQVRFMLGTPLLADAFHADRWDYPFYLRAATAKLTTSRVTVFFKDGFVARFDGGNLPSEKRIHRPHRRLEVETRAAARWKRKPRTRASRTRRSKRMAEALKLAVAGASGRMGRMLIETIAAAPDARWPARSTCPGSPFIGMDAGAFLGQLTGCAIESDLARGLAGADFLIDFTRPEGTLAHLAYCAATASR
jgi:outer membrane protein assembly factor BamE